MDTRESYQRELLLIDFFQRKQLPRDIINCILQWAKLTYLEILQILLRPGPLEFPIQWRQEMTVTYKPFRMQLHPPIMLDKVTITISNRNMVFVKYNIRPHNFSLCLEQFWDRIQEGLFEPFYCDETRLEPANKTYSDTLFDMVVEY